MTPAALPYYAHSTGPKPNADWQVLRDHLEGVAKLARAFAAETGVPGLAAAANAAGWLHDLGKYRASFQRHIRREPPMGPKGHKQAGAVWADDADNLPVAAAVLGHHGGMPDADDIPTSVDDEDNGRPVLGEVRAAATAECPEMLALAIPEALVVTPALDLFTRVLFSCLVDADWTDTGEHERRYKGWPAFPKPPALDPAGRLVTLLAAIDARAAETRPFNPSLADIRRAILDACLAAAERPRGTFTLTVPTGGGKTLSAMAFALRHAARRGLRRVIYVAPYISILDQNAAVIRAALGLGRNDLDLFEHQSLAEPRGGDTADERQTAAAARRAETWDAPVVVTTNVQFFESLFSNQPGRCRKLHNVAGSVIVLDECQSLPPDLVKPTCQMLKQLVGELGCTVVLCTATQPAFDHETLGEYRLTAHPIIPAGLDLFARLERVRLVWPRHRDETLTWAEVAAQMVKSGTGSPDRHAQSKDDSADVTLPRSGVASALAIVNTKAAARELFVELKTLSQHSYHLSTSMCPAHRVAVLGRVRRRLLAGESVFVSSTQLIEAGVDIDFPAVFREMAPLESVIQAAGRCNREGRIPDAGGRVVVFRSVEGRMPPDRWYKAGRQGVETVFLNAGREPRIDAPEDINEYYRHLYWTGDLDPREIVQMRAGLKFESCAKAYRLIDEDTVPVVIATWAGHEAEVAGLLAAVRAKPTRANFRALAPFQVNVFRSEVARLPKGLVVPLGEEMDLLVWHGVYGDELGRVTASSDADLVV